MILGTVNSDGSPSIAILVARQSGPAVIDTGFNGDVELPQALRDSVNARYHGPVFSDLAAGQTIIEDSYIVDFPFDGQIIQAEATFSPTQEILIGTRLLQSYRFLVHFPNRAVELERVV